MGFPGSVLLTGDMILKTTSAKVMPLGTRGYTRDGRVFRYGRNGGTALKPGYIVQSRAPQANNILLRSGTTKLSANSSKVSLVTIGGATETFVVKNDMADGYLFNYTSSTGTGALNYANGAYAQILTNTTQTATATGKVVINFQDGDGLYSATTNAGATTAVKIGVQRNPYDKVIVKPSGIWTALVVGVPVRPVAANYYFWVQTWGPCPVRADVVAYSVGFPVGPTTNTSARVSGLANSTKNTSGASIATWRAILSMTNFGVAMLVGVSGEYRMIYLKLAP